jgi:hypothetical protein
MRVPEGTKEVGVQDVIREFDDDIFNLTYQEKKTVGTEEFQR